MLCQLTCPSGTIYGKKGDWTFYGKKSQHGSIQVRLAHGTFEAERSVDKAFKESGPRMQADDEVGKAIIVCFTDMQKISRLCVNLTASGLTRYVVSTRSDLSVMYKEE